jgi:hypothetical protein
MLGFFWLIWLIFTGDINWENALVIFLYAYSVGVMISVMVVIWDNLTFKFYKSSKEVISLMFMAFVEPFLYHPLIVIFAIRGYTKYIFSRELQWGTMERTGTAKAKSPTPTTTTTSNQSN